MAAIAADTDLMEIIEEYGKATSFKYGELGMMIDRHEQQKVLDVVNRIRVDLDERMEKTRPSAAAITAAVSCTICNAAAGGACKFDGDPDPGSPPKIHGARIPPGWVNPGP